MTLDYDKVASIAAAVALGRSKADSGHLVTDQESSDTWDRIARQHADIVAQGLGVDIPSD